MAKPQPKPAKPASDTQGPPDLTLVDKAPSPPDAAPKAREAAKPRTTASQNQRRLHPSRVWPD
jgi:hypothetical protein